MRVGVYIDGYNLYYGGRSLCGRSTPGWRWLDLRKLSNRILGRSPYWISQGATVERIVYCTSPVSGGYSANGHRDQKAYLQALKAHGSIDLLEAGKFVTRIKRAPLATKPRGAQAPVLTTPQWPIKVLDADGSKIPTARFVVSYQHIEEKGSDVNVASHLLSDVYQQRVDAVIIITNDSDLRLPLHLTRQHVPVATINPQKAPLAADLGGQPQEGVGSHWWGQLSPTDFFDSQLPNPVDEFHCPAEW